MLTSSSCPPSLSWSFQEGGTGSGCPRYGGAETGRSAKGGLGASREDGGLHINGCASFRRSPKSAALEGVNFGKTGTSSARTGSVAAQLRPFFRNKTKYNQRMQCTTLRQALTIFARWRYMSFAFITRAENPWLYAIMTLSFGMFV